MPLTVKPAAAPGDVRPPLEWLVNTLGTPAVARLLDAAPARISR